MCVYVCVCVLGRERKRERERERERDREREREREREITFVVHEIIEIGVYGGFLGVIFIEPRSKFGYHHIVQISGGLSSFLVAKFEFGVPGGKRREHVTRQRDAFPILFVSNHKLRPHQLVEEPPRMGSIGCRRGKHPFTLFEQMLCHSGYVIPWEIK